MEFVYCENGSNTQPSIEEFEIDKATVVKKGQPLTLNTYGKAVVGLELPLGVAIEDHGSSDILSPRASGTKIKAISSPNAVFRLYGQTAHFNKSSSTATGMSVKDGLERGNGYYVNYYAVLVKKAEGSENTDEIGTARYVISSALDTDTDEFSLYVTSGGIPDDDDEYALVAAVGAASVTTSDYNTIKYEYQDYADFISVGCDLSLNNDKGLPCSFVKFKNHIKNGITY